MTWPIVARSYLASFERARAERTSRLHTAFQARTLAMRPSELPDLDLGHLRLLTDDTGMLQHATFGIPRYRDGYCVDDNARALLLMALVEESGAEPPAAVRALASRYLAFVNHAFDADSRRFRNFMAYERTWIEPCGSEDSHGRAAWALGTVVGRSSDPAGHGLAGRLFHAALPAVSDFTSPRAWAYTLLGIDEYLRAFEGDSNVESIRDSLAKRLHGLWKRTSRPDWPWFEDRVTYCNARLSQALIASGARMDDLEMIGSGLRSLEWLVSIQRSQEGYFAPIGSNGFFVRGGRKASFDQQPVEVCATISACLEAHRVTGQHAWSEHARRQFHWFLGQNQLEQTVYDPRTGGCRDGLHADRRNENQGAESTLSFLMSLTELRLADRLATAPLARAAPHGETRLPAIATGTA